jgi:hypothetical protein
LPLPSLPDDGSSPQWRFTFDMLRRRMAAGYNGQDRPRTGSVAGSGTWVICGTACACSPGRPRHSLGD